MISLTLLQTVVLAGGTVHSMSAPGPHPEATMVADILLENGRITALGPDLEAPAGALVIDVSGRHLVPGLIDGLAHFDREMDPLYIDAGVTFLRDLGGDMSRLLAERLPAARDEARGPSLMICGAVLDGPQPATTEAVILAEVAHVDGKLPQMKALGVDFLSFHLGLTPDIWRATLTRAAALELPVWGPLPPGTTLAEVAQSGQAGLLYLDGFLLPGEAWDTVDGALLAERAASIGPGADVLKASGDPAPGPGLAVVPVIGLLARLLSDPGPDAPILSMLAPHYAWAWEQERRAPRPGTEAAARALDTQLQLLAALDQAGVPLVPGSGSPHPWLLPGEGLLTELLLWVRAGLAPARVLYHATAGAAEVLSLTDRGRLTVGHVADILVLEEDPTVKLSALANPELVILRGQLIDREERQATLAELRDEQARRRVALAEPLEVPEPTLPEGDLVLAGRVETSGFGTRLSGERFAVLRTLDGGLAWVSHVRTPAAVFDDERNLTLDQRTREGSLQAFDLSLTTGGHTLTVSGRKLGSVFSVERRLDGVFVDNNAAREPVAFVDAGSITGSMLLARRSTELPTYALTFDDMDPVISRWRINYTDDGRLVAATDQGGLTAGFAADGRPAFSVRLQGNDKLDCRVLEASAFGGAGVPLEAGRVWSGFEEGAPDSTRGEEAGPDDAGNVELPADESAAGKASGRAGKTDGGVPGGVASGDGDGDEHPSGAAAGGDG
ncbi:MAG: hypothetical protein CMJ87_07515 [Planctomycetes bacterium]|nr:hypothetical protein [Planctomycetota bacterium]